MKRIVKSFVVLISGTILSLNGIQESSADVINEAQHEVSDNMSNGNNVVATTEGKEFFSEIGSDAQKIANANQLFSSIMMAQAALESSFGTSELARTPNYNLFGIKAAGNNNSVSFPTMEEDSNGNYYQIISSFRRYDSYKDSLEDYAKLLKNGVDWNSLLYTQSWKVEDRTFQEATQALTGTYATDSMYHHKLNAIIEAYELTQYDQLNGNLDNKETKDVYKVKDGDTLNDISAVKNTEIETILSLNPSIIDKNLIYTDQLLTLSEEIIESSEFVLPIKEVVVSSGFGERANPTGTGNSQHQGIDFAAQEGTEVMAAKEGIVVASGFDPSAGNYIILEHANGYYTSYFHLSKGLLLLGETSQQGQVIGLVGSTGDSTGPHLHFGISRNMWSEYINPSNVMIIGRN